MFHYEIHITIHTADTERFKAVCNAIGVKPIVLDLLNKAGDILSEVMTSSTISTDDASLSTVQTEVGRISSLLLVEGFVITRVKIETVPWHPDVPTLKNKKFLQNGQHFECHFGVKLHHGSDLALLKNISRKYGLHLSNNIFKIADDGSKIQMATFRAYMMRLEFFEATVNDILNSLQLVQLELEKPVKIEFAIYDSNSDHDKSWIS